MTRAILAVGSNLGDRLEHLRQAAKLLGDAVDMASGVYETQPWGDPDQPTYLNAVLLVIDPRATPRDWLDCAHQCERAAGRARDPERRFGPRTLDVDVIAVWDDADQPVLSEDPDLILPHPRAHRRAFVLQPWIDIQPRGWLPGHGWIADLLQTPALADEVAALNLRTDLAPSGSG